MDKTEPTVAFVSYVVPCPDFLSSRGGARERGLGTGPGLVRQLLRTPSSRLLNLRNRAMLVLAYTTMIR